LDQASSGADDRFAGKRHQNQTGDRGERSWGIALAVEEMGGGGAEGLRGGDCGSGL